MSIAADGVKDNAEVTGIVVYESSDNTTNVKLNINGQSRIGPNPVAPSTNCELWTNSDSVYSAALTAKTTGAKVNIRYIARGDNDAFCKVRYLYIR